MEIRLAEPRDVPGILALLRQVGSVHHEARPDLFRANAQKYGASQVLSMLDSGTNPIFVAVQEDKVVGYGFCQLQRFSRDPVMADRASLYIDDLCVDSSCRRQHIGTELFRAIRRWAENRDCQDLVLNVWACNGPALDFYESLGMKPRKFCMETLL